MRKVIFLSVFFVSLMQVDVMKAIFKPEKIFVRNITLEQGLSQCVVTDMDTDPMGFVWIGTFDGLNRFDGNVIKVFKHIPNDSTSLPSSKILRLFADNYHHVWVKTTAGLCVLDTRTGKVIPLSFLQDGHATVCGTRENNVWLYVKGKGLALVNTNNLSFKIFPAPSDLLSNFPHELDVFHMGSHVYVVAKNGDLLCYDIAANTYTIIRNDLRPNKSYACSGIDKMGNICFGSQEADMISYDPKRNVYFLSTLSFGENKLMALRSIEYDSVNDVMLFCTYGKGLFVYDYSQKKMLSFSKGGEDLNLSANYLQCTLSDRNGIIYVAYDGSGMDVLDPFIRKFVTIQKKDSDDLKSLRFVRKIIEDEHDNLLIGTSGSGLVRYGRASHSFSFYNNKNFLSNSDNFIIEMIRVKDKLWLGYNSGGIDIIDINTFKKTGHIGVGNSDTQLSEGVVWSFLDDGRGNIWVGTRTNGINKVNIATGKIKQFTAKDYPMLSSGIRCMTQRPNSDILVGTEDGLFEISIQNESIRKVFPTDASNQLYKSYKSIFIDNKERLWLCMDGMGILVLNKNFKVLRNFNSTNALNNDVVYGLLPANDSTFWFSSNAGLSCIRWNEKSLSENGPIRVSNYDDHNGLQSKEFNTGAFVKLHDGSMAFGGLNGINLFNPSTITDNQIVPDTYIQELKVYENSLRSDTLISYTSSIHLKPNENSISITFGTIGYSLPGKTAFKYRLIGNDEEWILTEGRNYVSYTNLKPGTYEFQVKACNHDGIWGDNYTQLEIIIASPFYKTWWFILLMVALIGVVVFLVYRYRHKIELQHQQLRINHTKEIAEVEMKALRAQINPHFLFNSLNSINSYILKNNNKEASIYLVKFSQLVRNILNNSSNAFVSLKEEINTIELYMQIEGMRFNNQFAYLIDIDPSIETGNVLIPSLLLQPYVENAIWHGLLHKEGEKNIAIRVTKRPDGNLCIQIEDNGIGRKMASEIRERPSHHKSFGMQLGESRLKLMNQGQEGLSGVEIIDKFDEQHHSEGTIIKICIPVVHSMTEKLSLTVN